MVLTLCFNVFTSPYIRAVWLCFCAQIRKDRCETYKKRRRRVLSNISTVAFSVGSPLEINNPVHASQAQFPQVRVTELFASKVATSAVITGHSSNDLEFLMTVLLERQCRHFRLSQIDLLFSTFSSYKCERGPRKWISLGPRIS